jgi:hypothetical protein
LLQVSIALTAEAAEALRRRRKRLLGSIDPQNQIAIIVGGRIVSSPTVVAPIASGSDVPTVAFPWLYGVCWRGRAFDRYNYEPSPEEA